MSNRDPWFNTTWKVYKENLKPPHLFVWLAKTHSNEHSIQVKLQMRILQVGEFTKILFLNSFICLFHILVIRLQWNTQAFSLLSMFDYFKYHQPPLLGLPSNALVQGCLDRRNILNASFFFEFQMRWSDKVLCQYISQSNSKNFGWLVLECWLVVNVAF